VVFVGREVIGVDLGTFGAVMKFAMDLELASKSFYGELHGKASEASLKSLFEKALARCPVRISTLERVRRENVTEMILEPIRGLDSESFPTEISVPPSADDTSLREAAVQWEMMRKQFFETAAQKIEFLIEASDAFQRLADEDEETLGKMR
jgi:hypothetical protein